MSSTMSKAMEVFRIGEKIVDDTKIFTVLSCTDSSLRIEFSRCSPGSTRQVTRIKKIHIPGKPFRFGDREYEFVDRSNDEVMLRRLS